MAILREAGVDAEAPEDLLAWARDDQPAMVLLSIVSPADWTVLEDVGCIRDDLIVVVMLTDVSVDAYVRAIRDGASVVLPRDADTATLREALVAALNRRSILPIDVLRALIAVPWERQDANRPTPTERQWLQDLSEGMTVNTLAQQSGYSERMMFRLLRDLYSRLGVDSRMAAIIRARDAGWIH